MEETAQQAPEDHFATLNLVLEEDVAANLDHYILLLRQGYFRKANKFFSTHLKKHAGWFPVIWEYSSFRLISNNNYAQDDFLLHALGTYTYTPAETNLFKLILGRTIEVMDVNVANKRLSDLLHKPDKDDIDIMTIKALLAISGREGHSPPIDADVSSYIKTLTDAGFWWEAYAAIEASCSGIAGRTTLEDCLSYLWDALNVPDLQPAEYGLDLVTVKLLKTEILIRRGILLWPSIQALLIDDLFPGEYQIQSGTPGALIEQTARIKKLVDAVTMLQVEGGPKQKIDLELLQIISHVGDGYLTTAKYLRAQEQLEELYVRADLMGYGRVIELLSVRNSRVASMLEALQLQPVQTTDSNVIEIHNSPSPDVDAPGRTLEVNAGTIADKPSRRWLNRKLSKFISRFSTSKDDKARDFGREENPFEFNYEID